MLCRSFIMEGAAGIVNGPQLSIMSLPEAAALDGAPSPFAPEVVQGVEGERSFTNIELSFPSTLTEEFPVGFRFV